MNRRGFSVILFESKEEKDTCAFARPPQSQPARARFDVALIVVLAPKGPDKIAQGNALGTRKTTKNEGKSPEGAQHPTGDVSPFQGSVEGLATGHPGRCPGLICGGPFGANEFSATPKLALQRL
jgi:hypothetical protein